MKKYLLWLTAALVLVIIFGTIYGVVQQSERLGANYPQIQLAEDGAAALNKHKAPNSILSGNVDIAESLAPFVIIYDKSGQPVASTGFLHGSIPSVPLGVLTAANGKPYHFVTWQPEPNVRIAAVSVAADRYYVLSGRSLAEVEKNEDKTFQLAAFGGVLSLLVLAAAYLLSRKKISD